MIHMIGYETSASDAALTAITPIPDPTLRVTGNDFLVPPQLPNIVLAAGMINSAAATLRLQIQSPSLRATLNFDISPINNGLVFGSLPRLNRLWQTPLPLVGGEPLDVFVQNGAAVMNRAFLMLSDGPVGPVSGKIYTVRATGAASLVTASWVNTTLTFGQTLPYGTYNLVGFRAWSANGVAARIFFVGYPWRPGVPMVNAEDNNEWNDFRFGQTGVWGQFVNTVPPTIDVMGITDTAQTFFLDLIKVA
jgi:hypothetical protein